MKFKIFIPLVAIESFNDDLKKISSVLQEIDHEAPTVMYSMHKRWQFPIVTVYTPEDHPVGKLLDSRNNPMKEKGWLLETC